MWLDNENREEALEVLRALGIEENRLKYMKFFDSGTGWTHRFEHHLGGRDGWSGLYIDKGPDFEDEDYLTMEDDADIEDMSEEVTTESTNPDGFYTDLFNSYFKNNF